MEADDRYVTLVLFAWRVARVPDSRERCAEKVRCSVERGRYHRRYINLVVARMKVFAKAESEAAV
jgi:hypothetical protein